MIQFISELRNLLVDDLGIIVLLAALAAFVSLLFDSTQKMTRRYNASRGLITRVLDLLVVEVANIVKQHEPNTDISFRASIFGSWGKRSDVISIYYYSTNMRNSDDLDIKLRKTIGATGYAWEYKSPVIADLTVAEAGQGKAWGLSDDQIKLTSKLTTIMAFPLIKPMNPEKVVAVLSLDTNEHMFGSAGKNLVAEIMHKRYFLELVTVYADIIAGILDEYGLAVPLD
ncbi:MAG: hypothetical protein EPO32_13290 [Anaerolineae bacterium]|nr:MAG: hypothetical protein EPO32_13290 [Anaerolineae bacterium]